jgi:hypothetical protein
MSPIRHPRGLRPGPFHLALAGLALLALAGPAVAGTGHLQPAGTLLLELDTHTSQFRLDDGDGNPGNDRFQVIFDQKLNKAADACLLGLTPPSSAPGVAPGNAQLVSLPGPTDWGIDTGKLALGSRTKKGTGCGQIEAGEVAHLETHGLILGDASIQVEAKQDASVRVILILDDGVTQTEVGRRYLLSGRAVANPPAEAAAHPDDVSVILGGRPDGGPDSGNNDDGFWAFSAPLHNVEVFQILTNSDGTQGKLSIKGGGEFPNPSANRSEWTVFEADGVIGCGDAFSCEGNDNCTSSEGGVSGNRTLTGACTASIPYQLKFDGTQVTFNYRDTAHQNPGIALDVAWESEAGQYPVEPTILSYDPDGVVDCSAGEFATNACIPLTLCEGTPIRRCSQDSTQACEKDADCAPGDTCRLVDLVAPGRCSDGASCQVDADCQDGSSCVVGFPDLVPSTPDTTEYGCICEEDVRYLGPGRCSNGDSCQVDADCADASVCEDRVAVEQCLFFVDDAVFLRGGKKSN